MKRLFLLLGITLFFGAGLSSCYDEAAEIAPEYKAPVNKTMDTDKNTGKESPTREG